MKDNPLFILLGSVTRHLVTGALLLLMTFLGLPEELQAEVQAAADYTAPLVTAFIAWVLLKNGKGILKQIGFVKCLLIGFILTMFPSCIASIDPATGQPQLSIDPKAVVQGVTHGVEVVNEKLRERQRRNHPPLIEVEPQK